MRPSRWLRTAILAVMLDDSPAEATTTFSPPVRNSEGDVLTCFAQNHSGGSLEVASVLRDESGASLGSFSAQVPAGQAVSLTTSSAPVAGAYCEFEFEGDAEAVRGFIRLTPAGGGNTRLLYEAAEVSGAALDDVATVSPPVRSGPAELIACIVQNLDAASAAITAQLRDSSGLLVAGNSLVVGAGDVVTFVSAAAPATPTYCTFSFDGNPSEVRGYIRISGGMGGNARLVAAAAKREETSTTVLHTPAVVPTGGVARCMAQNLGGVPVLVDADLLDANGEVLDSSGAKMVDAGHVESLANTAAESPTPVSCRFTFAAEPHTVRTYLAFTELLGGGTRILHAGTAAGGTAGIGATSFSPSLRNLEGSDIECWVQNLGAAPVDVAAALIDNMGGDVVVEAQKTVAAGHTVRLLRSSDDLLGAYCRFVFDGSPAEVRGSIVLNDGTPRLLDTASIAGPLTPAPTSTPTRTRTATRTATPLPSDTPTPTVTQVFTVTPSATATASPTLAQTATPSVTPTLAFTPTASSTPSPEPSATATAAVATATAEMGTPTATASSSPTPEPGFRGDANCDGIVSAADLVAVIGVIDSGIARGCGEDANGDGAVDLEDVEEIVALIFASS